MSRVQPKWLFDTLLVNFILQATEECTRILTTLENISSDRGSFRLENFDLKKFG